MNRISVFLLTVLIVLTSCRKAPKKPSSCDFSNPEEDNFTIVNNDDSPDRPFNVFCKKVDVFGVYIYATENVSDLDLLHTANIMAQYLDNNEDSIVDNPLVLDKMVENQSVMVLFGKENSSKKKAFLRSENELEGSYVFQDLYGDEIHPDWNHNSPFDATLEEVLHLVTHSGFSKVYPTVFGEEKGSEIANAMDKARGGQFNDVPSDYPSGAWYSYDDKTCEYNCQVTEYFYWALTSLLGAQDFPGRYDEIGHEWRANTPALLESMDAEVFNLLKNSEYKLPTVLPDGSYRR
tara:strand:- start:298 stop:1173 length:876 start_codon:yes stop_codon:yes gene_type:complete